MVSMSHSLLLRDLSILPTPVRWRSEYVHIVAQSREYVHTTYRVEVCPTRYEVATPILPRPQSYLSGGIPPRPRLAKGFLLCISYEVLGRSVTQPRSVASHTRSHAWPLVRAPPRASLYYAIFLSFLELHLDSNQAGGRRHGGATPPR